MSAPLQGLILAGGLSARMQRDKAALTYLGKSQLARVFELASRHLSKVFISVRAEQTAEPARAAKPQIVDSVAGGGPIVGIRSAFAQHPETAWLVLACDLPFLTDSALAHLLAARDPLRIATAYRSTHDGLPEPLCAIWEPAAGFCAEFAAKYLGIALPRDTFANINVPNLPAGEIRYLTEFPGRTMCVAEVEYA